MVQVQLDIKEPSVRPHRRAFKYFYWKVKRMKKAASIFLRADIQQSDINSLIKWMNNPRITQYMNEDKHVSASLSQLLYSVPAPMLSYHFNKDGKFFLICMENGQAIGFVKFSKYKGICDSFEIVYAIGEETLWGHGYGKNAIRLALSEAFFKWRATSVVAKICPENRRSIRSVRSCGFSHKGFDGRHDFYRLTLDEFLTVKKETVAIEKYPQ